MILSLIVWLAMQGQVQTTANTSTSAPIAVCKLGVDCFLLAEHVIEIKTRRTVESGPKEIGCYWWSSSKTDAPTSEQMLDNSECDNWREIRKGNPLWRDNGEAQMWIADKKRKVKVTRELWIDGVKFGIIKGLD